MKSTPGVISYWSTANSIIDTKDVKKYLGHKIRYPLELDFALKYESNYTCRYGEWISGNYWNDSMRRIVLGTVAPEMIRLGKEVRGLQLANS